MINRKPSPPGVYCWLYSSCGMIFNDPQTFFPEMVYGIASMQFAQKNECIHRYSRSSLSPIKDSFYNDTGRLPNSFVANLPIQKDGKK